MTVSTTRIEAFGETYSIPQGECPLQITRKVHSVWKPGTHAVLHHALAGFLRCRLVVRGKLVKVALNRNAEGAIGVSDEWKTDMN